MEVKIIRSKRKTFSIQAKGGVLLVRAPLRATDREVEKLLEREKDAVARLIEKSEAAMRKAVEGEPIGPEKIKELTAAAKRELPPLVERYAGAIGVTYGRISVRHQRGRWGSCSSKGDLSFNCLLMLMPDFVREGVVAHELCHIKRRDHSKAFYGELLRVFPDYDEARAWLRENGAALIGRMELGCSSESV